MTEHDDTYEQAQARHRLQRVNNVMLDIYARLIAKGEQVGPSLMLARRAADAFIQDCELEERHIQ